MVLLVLEAGAISRVWDSSDSVSMRGKIKKPPSFPLPWQETELPNAVSSRSWWAGLAHTVRKGIGTC